MKAVLNMFPPLTSLEAEFRRILRDERITTLYQPIISLKDGSVMGLEALSRGPVNSPLYSPLALLSMAEQVGKTWALERLLRRLALSRITLKGDQRLFLNIDPEVFNDQEFRSGFTNEFLQTHGMEPKSVVFELTERTGIENYEMFSKILLHYTEQGYGIAIDDVGSGYSSLKRLYKLRPDYIKIDMDFVRNIHRDTFKQSIVKSLVEAAQTHHIVTIAEGIESKDEMTTLIKLGVNFGQGYYIAKPMENVPLIEDEVINVIQKENAIVDRINNYSDEYHYIHHLMKNVKSFSHDDKCLAIHNYLKASGNTSVCIEQDGLVLGLASFREMNKMFAKQYGYSVYSHRPIHLITDQDALVADYYEPIRDVANRALNRPQESLYDDIIVSRGAKYVGMVSMKDVVAYAINYEKNYAKELNPLTSLPGNVIINRVLSSTIEESEMAGILYADLDNFKAFNDVYGFDQGDKVIVLTAKVIKEVCKKHYPYTSFVGHIGGDDFVIVADGQPNSFKVMADEIVEKLRKSIMPYFNSEDIANGFITTTNRQGDVVKFPLTSISVGGICGDFKHFYNDVDHLSKDLASIKKKVKELNETSSLIEHII